MRIHSRRGWLVLAILLLPLAAFCLVVVRSVLETRAGIERLEKQGAVFEDWVVVSPDFHQMLVSWGVPLKGEGLMVNGPPAKGLQVRKLPLSRPASIRLLLPMHDAPQLAADLKKLRCLRRVNFGPQWGEGRFGMNAAIFGVQGFGQERTPELLEEVRKRELPYELLNVLAALPELEELHFSGLFVSRRGWKTVGRLSQLKVLSIDWSRFDDRDCAAIMRLKNLQQLSLNSTQNRNGSIEALGELKSLQSLFGVNVYISNEGQAELKKLLPSASIAFLYL